MFLHDCALSGTIATQQTGYLISGEGQGEIGDRNFVVLIDFGDIGQSGSHIGIQSFSLHLNEMELI